MKKWFFIAIMILIASALSPAKISAANDTRKRLEFILNHIDDLYRSNSSRGEITMKILTEDWERELSMEIWSKGKDKSLIRILAPKKEKGTATLRSGNEIWNYLPKVDRVIKLPSSMMSDSWMGSHFTNDDLVKESRMADDYTYEPGFEGKRDGKNVVEVTCIPKEDAAVVWGKIVLTVEDPDLTPLSIAYYDEDMKLARTLTFRNVKELGGRKIPTEMLIQPSDKPDESTLVVYDKMEFDVPLDDGMFSIRNLKK